MNSTPGAILGAGTPASACHLTPGHWEQKEKLPFDCLQPVPLIRVGTPTGIFDINTVICNESDDAGFL